MTMLTDANTSGGLCNANYGTPAKGAALEVECDTCYVPAQEACHDEQGNKRPPHVSRARAARWASMFNL